jgi:[ribosomal protein S18]-alanine N-acetyltransferase
MAEELHLRIRKTTYSDIDVIVDIENQRLPHPWKKKYLTDELTHDISYFFLAEDMLSNRVAGYIIFWIIEDQIELHKIVTSEDYQRKGVGKKLLLFMLEIAGQKKVNEIFLEVRISNLEAIKFYEFFHFKLTGIRKNYYIEPQEDALIYRLALS